MLTNCVTSVLREKAAMKDQNKNQNNIRNKNIRFLPRGKEKTNKELSPLPMVLRIGNPFA